MSILMLPRELRDEIYHYVLAGRKWSVDSNGHVQNPMSNSLDLLRVCRQLNSETRLLPFTLSTFHTVCPDGFRQLCTSFTPAQKQSITNVEIDMVICGDCTDGVVDVEFPDWWVDSTLSMCDFAGLKHLHVLLEIEDWQLPLNFPWQPPDFEKDRTRKFQGIARAVNDIKAEFEKWNPEVCITVQVYAQRERELVALGSLMCTGRCYSMMLMIPR